MRRRGPCWSGRGSPRTSGARAGEDGSTIRLTERIEKYVHMDLGKRGLSQGDTGVYRSALLGRGGKVVGRGDGTCVSTAPKRARSV